MSKNPFLAIDKRILADAGTSRDVDDNLSALCDGIGPRFAGTPNYRKAADYVLDRFKQYKLDDAALEPFAFTAWRRGAPASLVLASPSALTIDCYALPYGAATPPEGVTARLLDIGGGSSDEIQAVRKRIKGRLVLTDGASGHRTDIYAQCAALGAAGFILSSPFEGNTLVTGSVAEGRDGIIPAISIGRESALQLQRLAKENDLRLTLTLDARLEASTTWNVVGELKGSERPEELVIMGGHLDSHELSHGAFDNGAGVVQVIEAARLLAKQRKHLKRTVRFIAFGAEEVGLLGSHYHAKTHAAELRKGRFMLNCDTPSFGRPRGLAFHECPRAAAYMAKLSEQMRTELVCQNRSHRHSDHYPFILQGLPTAGIGGGPFGPLGRQYPHTAADTLDKISLTDLRDCAAFSARILLRVASDDAWPSMRRSKKEIATWR
jgi:hypothetical protein